MPESIGRAAWLVTIGAALVGCGPDQKPKTIVYAALDREFSEPVLDGFTQATGIPIAAKYDEESTKSVGLTSMLIQEAGRPRCDVFWNNEILNTLRLDRRGMLESYASLAAQPFPTMNRSSKGTWYGFAARARVLIVNTDRVPAERRPTSIYDLARPQWKGRIGIARPVAGTTASHVACLFAALGPERAKDYFRSLKANEIQILGGNKQVATATAAGQIAFGLTDTDDALIELARGAKVTIIYPDRAPDELGTLFIPNTIAILKGCPHPAEARRLIDYLLSPAVERQLTLGESGQIPLNPNVEPSPRIETPRTVKAMEVNFEAAAEQWDEAAAFIEREFLAP
jgi:iron(III) transport system substrate-binding protein